MIKFILKFMYTNTSWILEITELLEKDAISLREVAELINMKNITVLNKKFHYKLILSMNIIKKALNSWIWKQKNIWKLNILCVFRYSALPKLYIQTIYTSKIYEKTGHK